MQGSRVVAKMGLGVVIQSQERREVGLVGCRTQGRSTHAISAVDTIRDCKPAERVKRWALLSIKFVEVCGGDRKGWA